MENKITLDLKTLKYIDFIFKLHSDNSCNTKGYHNLRKLIKEEEKNNHPLNESDIESLGFIPECKDSRISCFTKIVRNRKVELYRALGIICIKACKLKWYKKELELFKGKIKNKSELKVLLKQLGIYE